MDDATRKTLWICAALFLLVLGPVIIWAVRETRPNTPVIVAATHAEASAVAPNANTREPPPTAPSNTIKAETDIFTQNKSSREHYLYMLELAERMRQSDYAADREGTPLTDHNIGIAVRTGMYHFVRTDLRFTWRLRGFAVGEKVPVSWMSLVVESPFNHDLVVEAVKEFKRVTAYMVINKVMKEAELRMIERRPAEIQSQAGLWSARSDVHRTTMLAGTYLTRVQIDEWAPIDYDLENGRCRIDVYFAFIPEWLDADVIDVP